MKKRVLLLLRGEGLANSLLRNDWLERIGEALGGDQCTELIQSVGPEAAGLLFNVGNLSPASS